jgi:putative acetyltransferase
MWRRVILFACLREAGPTWNGMSQDPIMRIAIESPDQPEVRALIAALDAYQRSLYPPESTHLMGMAELTQPNVVFAVARDTDERAVGCGAVVLHPPYGELKRMYVDPRGRGHGVAKAILVRLESEATKRDCRLLVLETGPLQPEALGLYARNGFTCRARFGGYADDPLSVFMEKVIQLHEAPGSASTSQSA